MRLQLLSATAAEQGRDLVEDPVDPARFPVNVEKALLAENEVKKQQVALLIQLRNLLTDEQLNYLRSIN